MADNVLGTLFGDIADAIRTKTGDTAKMKPLDFPTKILGIEVGGGATAEDIIPEQELTFVYDESNGVYTLGGHNLFNITSIALGKEYKVVWGSDEYSCTAVEGIFLGQYPMIAIGNPVMVGGENNNLPFAIGYITIPDDGDSQYSCIIASLDGSATKNVRVYHEASAGVQDDRVKYVTFIGLGGVELYRQPVIVGDTCHNPVAKGYIETPTKESTVQYTYTYSGWSSTEGGSASSSALANVTEDRTVYAAFTSTVRQYTITFYDDDGTVLDSKLWNYGSMPSCEQPSKDGYKFSAWNPSVEVVTGNADYYATWIETTDIAYGTCGTSANWALNNVGVLTISGSGNMENYSSTTGQPWNSYKADIVEIVICEGITSVKNFAFYGCNNVVSVSLPSTLTSIGQNAFNALSSLTFIEIPANVELIASYSFRNCKKLEQVILNEGIGKIYDYTFQNCQALKEITIPSSCHRLGKDSFKECSALESVTFLNTTGWYVTTNDVATSGTSMTVSNPQTNATNIMTTYANYYWKCNIS